MKSRVLKNVSEIRLHGKVIGTVKTQYVRSKGEMKTPRQVLKEELIRELAINKTRVLLQSEGKVYTMSDGTKIIYTHIKLKSREMYELIEGIARATTTQYRSSDVWNWYLSASDKQIDKLAKEADKEA